MSRVPALDPNEGLVVELEVSLSPLANVEFSCFLPKGSVIGQPCIAQELPVGACNDVMICKEVRAPRGVLTAHRSSVHTKTLRPYAEILHLLTPRLARQGKLATLPKLDFQWGLIPLFRIYCLKDFGEVDKLPIEYFSS